LKQNFALSESDGRTSGKQLFEMLGNVWDDDIKIGNELQN
jgi:hypothetical protein